MGERVFISYSSKDALAANMVCGALDKRGITYFRDCSDKSGIDAASYFVEVLSKTIPAVDVLLLIMTENSMSSPWCKWEIICARAEDKEIFPLSYDGYDPSPRDLRLLGDFQVKNKIETLISDLAARLGAMGAEPVCGAMNRAYGSYAASRGGKTVYASGKKMYLIQGESDLPAEIIGAPVNADGIAFISDNEIICNDNASGKMVRFDLRSSAANEIGDAGRMPQFSTFARTNEPCLFYIDGEGYICFINLSSGSGQRIGGDMTDRFYLLAEGILFRSISDRHIYSYVHTKTAPPKRLDIACTDFCYEGGSIYFKDEGLAYPESTYVYRYDLESRGITVAAQKVLRFNPAGGMLYYTDALSRRIWADGGAVGPDITNVKDFMVVGDCIFYRSASDGGVGRLKLKQNGGHDGL